MKKNHKNLWIFIFIISILIVVCCFIYFAVYFFGKKDYGNYKENGNLEYTSEIPSSSNLTDNPVDWKKIQKSGKDVYAWIHIPNTNIDYPVVQSGEAHDDFFYLNHNIEGNYEFGGSIYSEKQNSKDFSDSVTILYGHNLKNGTMFADLHKFENEKFFNKNKFLYIYTPECKLTYEIYAAYVYDDRHILNTFDFSDKQVLYDYFQYTLNPKSMTRNVRTNITLDKNSKIITLSTCTNGAENTRYLVQGVLTKTEPTN